MWEQAIGGALKEAKDAAAAAEAANKELETKVAQLEAGLRASGEELTALKREREKDAAAHGELQGLLAERSKELSAAKDSNADLKLKLATLTQTLDGDREREVALSEKIKADKALLASAAAAHDAFRETVEHWTEGLVDAAAAIDGERLQLLRFTRQSPANLPLRIAYASTQKVLGKKTFL